MIVLHITHVINDWLRCLNWSKKTSLPNLTKTVESEMLQGNGPCHFAKCVGQWLYHPVKKYFVAGIYFMLPFLNDVLSKPLTIYYMGMWLVKSCMFTPKQVKQCLFFPSKSFVFLSYTACLIFNMYCHLKLQGKIQELWL